MSSRLHATVLAAISLLVSTASAQNKQDERTAKVKGDKQHVEGLSTWIYDDLPKGIETAKQTKRPLLVVFRCIPCEACAQLDEKVVDRDPAVRELLDQFVCVRIPHANGIDLSLFQFDWDQSWAAFFLNADLTIYGRYGTRSSRTDSADDVSLEGFGKALQAALAMHAAWPRDKEALAKKRGPALEAATPEQLPSLRGRYGPELDWAGKVVPSCVHCHMVGEALRLGVRKAGKPLTDEILFPYPNPKALGLVLDAKEGAVVARVEPGSAAEKAGFATSDAIVSLAGQPILSIADVQWVLHGSGETQKLEAVVRRDHKSLPLTLALAPGWRAKDDIAWRTGSWDLRRMVTGGMLLEELPDADRKAAGLDAKALALRAKHVGEYGEHAAAKNAGFRKGDVLVAIDGKSERLTEGGLMAALVKRTKPGDKVAVTVLRGEKKVELTLPMQ